MKNIFENIYFGKPYKTKDNRKALLLEWRMEIGSTNYYDFAVKHAKGDGYDIKTLPDFEILSEWQESIDEEKLNKLAWDSAQPRYIDVFSTHKSNWVEGFKAGYRKAKEYIK